MSSEFGGGMKDKRDRRDIPAPLFRPLRYALCAMPYACLPAGALRPERQDIEAHGLRISKHDIHILNSLARGPFHQIVNGGHDHPSAI